MTTADAVWYNGVIYLADEDFSTAESIAVKDGKVLAVGTNCETASYIGENTNCYDLEGKSVLPGLHDAHLHFLSIGENMATIDCYWKPKEEILTRVSTAARNAPKGKWLTGWGWNQAIWSPAEFPTKAELDEASPDNPVMLTRTCGHVVWLNSAALERTGITEDIENPVGGEFLRDERGLLTGIVTDQAMMALRDAIPPHSKEEIKEMLLAAQSALLSAGITYATSAGELPPVIECIKELYESGDLKMRLNVMVQPVADRPAAEVIEKTREWLKRKPQRCLYEGRLQIQCLKIYTDGSLGGRSAWMLEDYCDRAGHRGNAKLSDEELYTLVREAHASGMQVSTHAIGDAANRQVLDAYERVLKESPCPDHRFRIEHAQIISPEDFPRFKQLGVIPSMQTVHAASDMNMAEERIGLKRLEYSYAWRKFIDDGLFIPNGTDAPVEAIDPWLNFYAAVTRKDKNGSVHRGFCEKDAMTRKEALLSYTLWPAYACFAEKTNGSLEPGKCADFIIIDSDIMTCPQEEILNTKVVETVVAGEKL